MKVLPSICNMGTHGLPDMFTLSPQAHGSHASDVHIRQTTHAHVTNTKFTLCICRLQYTLTSYIAQV